MGLLQVLWLWYGCFKCAFPFNIDNRSDYSYGSRTRKSLRYSYGTSKAHAQCNARERIILKRREINRKAG